jgi:PIN domain nuclease of toxin-antitoxin system
MRYLLDTHTALWFLEDSEKLSKNAATTIESVKEQSDICISIASLWEFTIKHNLGKLRFEGGLPNLCALIEINGWTTLSIVQGHLEYLSVLPMLHRDPFDRLLIATALSEKMTFVTADENIQNYDVMWVW